MQTGTFDIRPATAADVDAAVAVLGAAFAPDPLMAYLFADHPNGQGAATKTFFAILLRARLALGMPAFVLRRDGQIPGEIAGEILGAAMGYDATRPQWPAAIAAEWQAFETSTPDLAGRMAAYDAICESCQPAQPHHYLGVIGVHPSLQGQGAGKALLEAFCDHARADPTSHGVYLDTTNPDSLAFYDHTGFQRRGEGHLGDTPVWCVWRPL